MKYVAWVFLVFAAWSAGFAIYLLNDIWSAKRKRMVESAANARAARAEKNERLRRELDEEIAEEKEAERLAMEEAELLKEIEAEEKALLDLNVEQNGGSKKDK